MKVSEGLSRVKSLLGNWATPRELPPQLTWKYEHESELLSWRIKARNYNTVVANGIFIFMLFLPLQCASSCMTFMKALVSPGEHYLACVFSSSSHLLCRA